MNASKKCFTLLLIRDEFKQVKSFFQARVYMHVCACVRARLCACMFTRVCVCTGLRLCSCTRVYFPLSYCLFSCPLLRPSPPTSLPPLPSLPSSYHFLQIPSFHFFPQTRRERHQPPPAFLISFMISKCIKIIRHNDI